MNKPKSDWQTRELSTIYLEGVRGAIPGADLQMSVIAKIARLWCSNPLRILDLGCGNGIIGRFLINIFPSAHGIFVDFSDTHRFIFITGKTQNDTQNEHQDKNKRFRIHQ